MPCLRLALHLTRWAPNPFRNLFLGCLVHPVGAAPANAKQPRSRFPYGLKAENGELGTRLLCFRWRRAHKVGKAVEEKAAGGGGPYP